MKKTGAMAPRFESTKDMCAECKMQRAERWDIDTGAMGIEKSSCVEIGAEKRGIGYIASYIIA